MVPVLTPLPLALGVQPKVGLHLVRVQRLQLSGVPIVSLRCATLGTHEFGANARHQLAVVRDLGELLDIVVSGV